MGVQTVTAAVVQVARAACSVHHRHQKQPEHSNINMMQPARDEVKHVMHEDV
jgi:hypothetical protein